MTPRRQLVIAAVGGILVTVLFFVFLLSPKLDQVADLRGQTEDARDQEQVLRNDLARLQDVRKNAPKTRARLARVSDLLPSEPDLPGFIRLLQGAATRQGVDLISIAPSQPTDLEGQRGVQVITVTVAIEASFSRTENFLVELEGLNRVVEVTSLGLAPVEDALSDQVRLAGSLGLRMYVVADGSSSTSTGGA